MNEIIDQLDFIKMKNICSKKDSVKRIRRQDPDWDKILGKKWIKDCYQKYTKKISQKSMLRKQPDSKIDQIF